MWRIFARLTFLVLIAGCVDPGPPEPASSVVLDGSSPGEPNSKAAPADDAAVQSASGPTGTTKAMEICFTVTNGVGARAQLGALQEQVRGVRYAPPSASADTVALVFTAGGGMGTQGWEIENLSMPRLLASRGYAVFTYDRVGEGQSKPASNAPGYPYLLTGHQDMLSEVVAQVQRGTYVARTDGACEEKSSPAAAKHERVVVGGFSLGGAIASGYVARHPDQAVGLIQMDFSSFGFNPDFLDMIGRTVQKYYDQDYGHFPYQRSDCDALYFYGPGMDEAARETILASCEPNPDFVPKAMLHSMPAAIAEHATIVQMIPADYPVLLTFADHSFPYQGLPNQNPQHEEENYWHSRPGCQPVACDVESWWQTDSNHGFMFHRSMPQWVDRVATWLETHEFAPTP